GPADGAAGPRAASALCFTPDGRLLAGTSGDTTVRVWDATTGREKGALTGHTGRVRSLCYSPDGRRLARAAGGAGRRRGAGAGAAGGAVRVWDAATDREELVLQGHTDFVTGVCFSPDGKRLASASWDGTVKVWDTATGREARTLPGQRGPVSGVCYSPDGRLL